MIVCEPVLSIEVEKVALEFGAVPAVSVAVPMGMPPSLKVTVPVGELVCPATVTVRVAAVPSVAAVVVPTEVIVTS